MERVLFINLIVLFTCNFLSAQQGFEIDKSDELFEKDWTNFNHLFSDEKEGDKNQVDLSEPLGLSLSGITQNNKNMLGHKLNSYAEMPIYVPEGNHNMPIHVPDSTIQHHIKTYDPK